MADTAVLFADLQLGEAVLGALDLLLRWVVLRVCEGNTQCLLRVLELASRLLDCLYDQVGRCHLYTPVPGHRGMSRRSFISTSRG